jgi:hypothetical protein
MWPLTSRTNLVQTAAAGKMLSGFEKSAEFSTKFSTVSAEDPVGQLREVT